MHGPKFYLRKMRQHRRVKKKKYDYSKWLDNAPFRKGIIIKTEVKPPLKPNSGNRKVVKVRLSSGRVQW